MDRFHRRSIRLKDYDYTQPGSYFVTICTHNKESLFGDVIDGTMVLNEFGELAKQEILKTELVRENVEIDKFVILPNHIHLLIVIWAGRGTGAVPLQWKCLENQSMIKRRFGRKF